MQSSPETEDHGNKTSGLLGFMSKGIHLRKKKKTKRTVEAVQQQPRRIVKALPPPENPPQEQASLDEDARDEPDDVSEIHLPVTKLPLVQNQLDIDHALKWRQQRLDVSAALRKELKEREIKDIRSGCGKSPKHLDSNPNAYSTIATTDTIPSILSVESQFPEHKRTVLERGTEEETCVKRSKYVDELILEKIEKKEKTSMFTDTIRTLGAKLLPATAVAIAAICFMKFLRR